MDILAIIGAVTFAIGWAWLAITAFKRGNYIWGILIILAHSLAGLIFCILNRTGFVQYAVMLAGMILFFLGYYLK